MRTPRRLPRSFYARPTLQVAPDLLGKLLVRRVGRTTRIGRITEVEAYDGEEDLACHASRGRTPRTETLYATPGTAYVYLIYGMYHCLNVVTDRTDHPAAVLIRSCAPVTGVNDNVSLVGPGRLCRALSITRAENGLDLTKHPTVWLADDGYAVPHQDIEHTPRIGVDYAQHCAQYPWRFALHGSSFVSLLPKQRH